MATYKGLVLFDIDGTLLRRAGPHHREALVHGVRRVTGLETTTAGIPVQGMLDPVILTAMMRNAGLTPKRIREAMPAVVRAAENRYLRTCPALHEKHCPGVEPLLDRLAARGLLLGLVTGNLTRIGKRKLECAGLGGRFRFGAFGEMAATRTGLAKIAIREARAKGWIARGAPIALVGDAPADVIAAHGNGIRSIAVKTGISAVEEVEAENPDYLIPNLRHLRFYMIGV